MKERESFGSRLGFILVSAGCAVGLGNVWKFPYICGEFGGAAFIVLYLGFLLLLGLPILVCEFSVGRASKKGIALAFDTLEKSGSKWHSFKWFAIVGNYLLMMFYTMIGGWMIYYAYRMATGQLSGITSDQITSAFNDMLADPKTMTFWMVVAVAASLGICAIGLQKGIERITKVMMSLLLILIIVLAIHSLTLPNASEGVRFYLIPDFQRMAEKGIGTAVYAAMSHAFFTLSVGMGTIEIFGSYMSSDNTLLGESVSVMILDTVVALAAGFIIIPACFSFGVEPNAGPPLLFQTLPNVFSDMSGGRIWGTAFFVFMSFAALSTIIAVFENILAFYMDLFGWSRKKAVIVNLFAISLLSLPAVLGYNLLSDIQPMGAGSTIMDVEDFFVSYNILPLGSMIFVLFCTRKNGWGWDAFMKEANTGEGKHFPQFMRFYMSYILPVIIVGIYLKGYYDTFQPKGTKTLVFWMSVAILILATVCFIVFAKTKSNSSKE